MKSDNPIIGKTFGYARVSTEAQNEDRQLIALRKAGVDENKIYIDHKSGKDFRRPAWCKLVRQMKRGDLLIITSIDRMGRNYCDILSEWRTLVKTKGVFVRVLDMPLIDTTTTQGLLSMFISDLVLQILSFVAETEREHIKARQREGINAARARGVKFGRPMKPIPSTFDYYWNRYENGDLSLKEAARSCGMSKTTFWRKTHRKNNSQRF